MFVYEKTLPLKYGRQYIRKVRVPRQPHSAEWIQFGNDLSVPHLADSANLR